MAAHLRQSRANLRGFQAQFVYSPYQRVDPDKVGGNHCGRNRLQSVLRKIGCDAGARLLML